MDKLNAKRENSKVIGGDKFIRPSAISTMPGNPANTCDRLIRIADYKLSMHPTRAMQFNSGATSRIDEDTTVCRDDGSGAGGPCEKVLPGIRYRVVHDQTHPYSLNICSFAAIVVVHVAEKSKRALKFELKGDGHDEDGVSNLVGLLIGGHTVAVRLRWEKTHFDRRRAVCTYRAEGCFFCTHCSRSSGTI